MGVAQSIFQKSDVVNGKWIRLFGGSKDQQAKLNRLRMPKGYYPFFVDKVDKGTLAGQPSTRECGTTLGFGAKEFSSDICLLVVTFLFPLYV